LRFATIIRDMQGVRMSRQSVVPAGRRFRAAGRAVLVVVGLVAAVGLAACGGPDRSAASFCAELKTDTGRMSQRATTANPDLTGQLSAALGNLGDFTRMLHQLDDRAPDEIKTDMDQTVKAWDDQQQALSQAAQNPLGAMVASLSSSLFNSASIHAVDEFAVDNCGMSIFGTVAAPVPGGGGGQPTSEPSVNESAGGAFDCPENSDVDYSSIVDGQTTYAQLTQMLQTLSQGPSTVATAASALANATAALSPPPGTSLEALGRLSFAGNDPTALLKTLNSAVADACGGSGIWSDDTVNGFDSFGPPTLQSDGGVQIGGAYGSCQDESPDGWIPPFTEIIDCQDGTVDLVDLGTGAVTTVTGPPQDTDTVSSGDISVAGNEIAWVGVEIQPAQGLSQATWTATLHIRDAHGGTVADVQVDHGTGDAPSPDSFLAFATAGHILIALNAGGGKMVDGSGATLWTTKLNPASLSQPTPHSLVLDPSHLVNIDTGKVLYTFPNDDNKDADVNGCGTLALVSGDFDDDGAWVSESASGAVTVKTASSTLMGKLSGNSSVTTSGVVSDADGSLRAFTQSGRQLWSISDDIAQGEVYVGGWIVVTNPSGEQVLVDAATGKDTTKAQPDLAAVLLKLNDHLTIGYADPGAGVAILYGDSSGDNSSGQVAYKMTYQQICG
jgi:hypothetical protein